MRPTGKLPTEPRKFRDVVADFRHVVFSVIRDRPNAIGGVDSAPLGTGFFVGPDVFITCHHVINAPHDLHYPGDSYRLIANLTGNSATVHRLPVPQVGKELILFPDLDLAILMVNAGTDHPYASIAYDQIHIGEEIGVAGYPMAALNTDANGDLLLEGLIYRAARGPVTARYNGAMEPTLPDLPIVEVNFMFVAGNSGGPIFEVETGRVIAMVQGFQWRRIGEVLLQSNIPQLPLGVMPEYIAPLIAIYSWGIKLDCLRTAFERAGVLP